ncbi:sp110 nuclear body protein-like [Nannospalax galili]|uniref:sp110 nuclear body protein-like n=1 Tax=Nannospalax galili TaxID=1026970 RepID=UPI00111BDC66|nr:sp110 nuclear body protein-like [Nannospalax galili]
MESWDHLFKPRKEGGRFCPAETQSCFECGNGWFCEFHTGMEEAQVHSEERNGFMKASSDVVFTNRLFTHSLDLCFACLYHSSVNGVSEFLSVPRMLTVTKALEEALLQHFIYQKLDIAYAINKPFPFFEALRDNYFITERMYKENCSRIPQSLPVSSRDHQTEDKQDPQEMSHAPSGPVPVTRDNLTSTDTKEEGSAELPSRVPGTVHSHTGERYQRTPREDDSNRSLKVVRSTQKTRIECAQVSRTQGRAEGGTCCGLASVWEALLEWPQGGPLFTKRRENLTPPFWAKLAFFSVIKGKESGPLPTSCKEEWFDAATPAAPSLLQPPFPLPPQTPAAWISSSQIFPEPVIFSEKPEDDTADFLSLTLPVTCGEAKGILYKEKMKAGSSEKCIRNEQGAWLTPKEFLVEGKRAKSKDWKRSMHCGGKTLRHLQEKGLLFCPPMVNFKR